MTPVGSGIPSSRIGELRRRAQSIDPPGLGAGVRTPELVDVEELIPGIVVDLKYASDDNFIGHPLYDGQTALLQRPVAESLTRVQEALKARGAGLILYDAYRPWWVTWLFWEAMPVSARTYLADPAKGSRHNRGCAVDVGLVDLDSGEPLSMPSGFDEFTERAHVGYRAPADEARHRDLLIGCMEQEEFSVYSKEWWHFDHDCWGSYPVMNVPVP